MRLKAFGGMVGVHATFERAEETEAARDDLQEVRR